MWDGWWNHAGPTLGARSWSCRKPPVIMTSSVGRAFRSCVCVLPVCRHFSLSLWSRLSVQVPDTVAASSGPLQGTTTLCPQSLQAAERTRTESRDFQQICSGSAKGFFLLCITHSGFHFYLNLLNVCFACFCSQVEVPYNQFCSISFLFHVIHTHLLNAFYVPFHCEDTWEDKDK